MINTLKLKIRIIALVLTVTISGLLSNSVHAQDFSDYFSNNGSFEFGSSPPPLSFPSPNSTVSIITGWKMHALGEYPLWLEDINAQNGNRYIRLRSAGGSGTTASFASVEGSEISHTPFTTGDVYELSFWAAGGASLNNTLLIGIGSGIVEAFDIPDYTQAEFDALPTLAWNRYSMNFIAPYSTFTLDAVSPDSTNPAFNSIVYLDNFSIVAVP